MDTDVLRQIQDMQRRWHNLNSRDIEAVAVDAGWIYSRTKGSHVIYTKEGFWANLSIPEGKVKGRTALRLLGLIEASLYEEEEE